MKKTFSTIFLSLITFIAFAGIVSDNEPPKNIIIIKPIKNPSQNNDYRPLNIVKSEIEAFYHLGTLTFIFNNDLGNIDITVTNLSTGDAWFESNCGVCTSTITLSGDSGCYIIEIQADNGYYTGEFYL